VVSVLDKLAVLGRSGLLLAGVAALLLVGLLVPSAIRQIYWLAQSERIIEETADPVILDYVVDPNFPTPIPRTAWAAGQTLYIQRSVCVYQRVTGSVERAIVDTARIDLGAVPLSGILEPGPGDYDAKGKLKPPPWCGTRIGSVTIPAFMAPGPAYVSARIDAHLNPLRPHVFIPLRPAPFVVESSPLRSELETTRERTRDLREALDARTLLLTRKLDLLLERMRDAERTLERVESYHRLLDQHLRATRVLPPAKGTP
jgi:hypothetical protein